MRQIRYINVEYPINKINCYSQCGNEHKTYQIYQTVLKKVFFDRNTGKNKIYDKKRYPEYSAVFYFKKSTVFFYFYKNINIQKYKQ